MPIAAYRQIFFPLLTGMLSSFLYCIPVFFPPSDSGATSIYYDNPCSGKETSLLVDAIDHRMMLCEKDRPVGEYRVALGRGGIYKKKQGDKKTPIGEYSLGMPRISDKFSIFIPIGYPTEEQQFQGFSGNDIGIHGPTRRFKKYGSVTAYQDWTQGCIALGSDDDIYDVARWIIERNVSKIIIY